MSDQDWLAEQFEGNREHLGAVAYRMLGSHAEADDAVQEAWLRLSRADTTDVANLGGWLTTVVSRVCLDMLRTRTSRREAVLDQDREPVDQIHPGPEHDALMADAVGPALLVVLESLAPGERIAFVLHDLFGVPFDEVATIVGRSPAAARQLASRARRRVRGADPVTDADRARRREIVDAFLDASRNGEFEALIALLDPQVVVRADATAAKIGAEPEIVGAQAVAQAYLGRAKALRRAVLDGEPGAAWMLAGEPQVVFSFTIGDGLITGIELLADRTRLADLDLELLSRSDS